MLDKPINEYRVTVNEIEFPFSFAVLVPGLSKEEADDVMFNIILKWRKHVNETYDNMYVTPMLVNGELFESADEPLNVKTLNPTRYSYHFSFDECRRACFDVVISSATQLFADLALIEMIKKWRDLVDFEFCQTTVLTPIRWGQNGNPETQLNSYMLIQINEPTERFASFTVADRDSLIQDAEYVFTQYGMLWTQAAQKLVGSVDESMKVSVLADANKLFNSRVDIDVKEEFGTRVPQEVKVVPVIYNRSEADAESVNGVIAGMYVLNTQDYNDNIPNMIPVSTDVSVPTDFVDLPVNRITAGPSTLEGHPEIETLPTFILQPGVNLESVIENYVDDNSEQALMVSNIVKLQQQGYDVGAIVRAKTEEYTNENRPK
jgi:hypothetical protein